MSSKKVSCRHCKHSRSQDWAYSKNLIEWPSRVYDRWCDLHKYLVKDKPRYCNDFKRKQRSTLLEFTEMEVT